MNQLKRSYLLLITSLLMTVAIVTSSLQLVTAAESPSKIWQQINSGAVVIDVRTAEEFNSGHLAGAIHIPYEQIVQGVKLRGIAKETPIVTYCRSGRRSGIAQQSLLKSGYSQVYNGGGLTQLASSKVD